MCFVIDLTVFRKCLGTSSELVRNLFGTCSELFRNMFGACLRRGLTCFIFGSELLLDFSDFFPGLVFYMFHVISFYMNSSFLCCLLLRLLSASDRRDGACREPNFSKCKSLCVPYSSRIVSLYIPSHSIHQKLFFCERRAAACREPNFSK